MTDARKVIGRRTMRLWVERESVMVSFTRRPLTADGSGGKTPGVPVTIAPQEFRVAATARQHDMESTTTAGELQGADWLLVGAWNANVEKDDKFDLNDRHWVVKFVDQRTQWRKAAGVIELGKQPS